MPDPAWVMIDLSAPEAGPASRDTAANLADQLRDTLLAQGLSPVNPVPAEAVPGGSNEVRIRLAAGGITNEQTLTHLRGYLRGWYEADPRWRGITLRVNGSDITGGADRPLPATPGFNDNNPPDDAELATAAAELTRPLAPRHAPEPDPESEVPAPEPEPQPLYTLPQPEHAEPQYSQPQQYGQPQYAQPQYAQPQQPPPYQPHPQQPYQQPPPQQPVYSAPSYPGQPYPQAAPWPPQPGSMNAPYPGPPAPNPGYAGGYSGPPAPGYPAPGYPAPGYPAPGYAGYPYQQPRYSAAGGGSSFRAVTILGLIGLILVAPLSYLYARPPWRHDFIGQATVSQFFELFAAELLVAVVSLIALILLLNRARAAPAMVGLARGGAAWMLALGGAYLFEGFKFHQYGSDVNSLVALALHLFMLIAGALVLLGAWARPPFTPSRFPVMAGLFALAAIGEGWLAFHRYGHLYLEVPSYFLLITLGVAGLFLLGVQDDDPSRIFVWLGWGVSGSIFMLGLGMFFAAEESSPYDTHPSEIGLDWKYCLIAMIIPAAVVVIALVHQGVAGSRPSTPASPTQA